MLWVISELLRCGQLSHYAVGHIRVITRWTAESLCCGTYQSYYAVDSLVVILKGR